MKQKIIIAAVLLLSVLTISTAFAPKTVKHAVVTNVNVIMMICDDFGYELPEYTGGESYSTPELNALAATSARLNQCHGSPTCSPSRMMLNSGQYNFRNYLHNRSMDISVKTVGNLCKLGGYTTAMYGKWQLDGGDSLRQYWGFDYYAALFARGQDEEAGIRYKNPKLLHPTGVGTADYYYPGADTYSDDVFVDSSKAFMNRANSTSTPFFLQLCWAAPHTPWSPSPDHADYAGWDPLTDKGDIKYYPDMIHHLDKNIGRIVSYVKDSLGIGNNTVIIIVGDNGTASGITSMWNGQLIEGAKKTTINYATHVPCIAYWQGHTSGATNTSLISFTDMMPTISDITGIPIPGGWGTIDGYSFYPLLAGTTYTPRNLWYLYWGSTDQNSTLVWDMKYNTGGDLIKLYSGGKLYNTTTDPLEYCPITDNTVQSQLQAIIDGLHQ